MAKVLIEAQTRAKKQKEGSNMDKTCKEPELHARVLKFTRETKWKSNLSNCEPSSSEVGKKKLKQPKNVSLVVEDAPYPAYAGWYP